jgi:capsular exopolysaccharide synthesis family protein
LDLSEYLTVIRKRWITIVACVLVAGLAAGLLCIRATPQYQSHLQFFVSTNGVGADAAAAYDGGLFSQERTTSYADIVTGPLVAQDAELSVPNASVKTIEDETSANAVANSVLLNVTVTDPSAARAQRIAAAIGIAFPKVVHGVEATGKGTSPVKVSVVKPATYSGTAVSPKVVRDVALAVIIGLLLGLGLAVLRETLDTTVRDPEAIQRDFGVPTLGAIAYDPDAKRRPLVVQADPRSPRAEAFRRLRTNLQYVDIDAVPRSLVFTSSVPEEGKTTTVTNLAITMAQAGLRVAVIEADLRRPRLAEYLGLESAVGLTNVLVGSVTLDDAIQSWGEFDLAVLASGPTPPNPSELLGSKAMADLVSRLERGFDMVLIDAPPLLPVTDAAVIASVTAGAIIIVRDGHTKQRQLGYAVSALHSVEARIYGAILTMVPTKGPNSHYYGYKYRYAVGTEDLGPPVQPVRQDQPDSPLGAAATTAAGSGRDNGRPIERNEDTIGFFS